MCPWRWRPAMRCIAARRSLGGRRLHRPHPLGDEDFVYFAREPERQALAYRVDVSRVAGLRLVSRTLEFLDPGGAPRLRVAPPFVVDAGGRRLPANLAVGCAADVSPRAPWGRPVTPPGASSCVVTVSWARAGVRYPALVDPQWTSTQQHHGHPPAGITRSRPCPIPGTPPAARTPRSSPAASPPAGPREHGGALRPDHPDVRGDGHDGVGARRPHGHPVSHVADPGARSRGPRAAPVASTAPETLTGGSIATEVYDQGIGHVHDRAEHEHGALLPHRHGPRRRPHPARGRHHRHRRPAIGSARCSSPPTAPRRRGAPSPGRGGPMQAARFGHAAAVLQRRASVLLTGGIGASGTTALTTAETFCPPATCADYDGFNGDTFEAIASMTAARAFHTATAIAGRRGARRRRRRRVHPRRWPTTSPRPSCIPSHGDVPTRASRPRPPP